MDKLTLQHSPWFILLCLLAGLLYAAALYYRDTRFRENARGLNIALGALRALTVSFICMLLLAPLMRSVREEVQKPIILFAQDLSESVGLHLQDQSLQEYAKNLETIESELSDDYEFKKIGFGSSLNSDFELEFDQKSSNISSVLDMIHDQYASLNLGAVILASDGIYNEGNDPVYSSTLINAPIYTIGLGDTTIQKDLVVKRVLHNRIAYLNDRFGVEVDIEGLNANGERSALKVEQLKGNTWVELERNDVRIAGEQFFKSFEVVLNAVSPGVQRYRFSLSPIAGEENKSNNVKEIFVDILDARQKILILANAPHPDVSALKRALENNKNYDVVATFADDYNLNTTEFDLLVLHSLPSIKQSIPDILSASKKNNIPIWYIVGSTQHFAGFNKSQDLIEIKSDLQQSNEVQAGIGPNFNLFTLSDQLRDQATKFPPLYAPFGEFNPTSSIQPLFYQRIGKVDTEYPLIAFGEHEGRKVAILTGEGIWKWRLFDYLQNQSHDIFNELVGKTVQYLTVKEDKRRFRVKSVQNIFDENEALFFQAEFYNETYELVNEDDVSLTITDASGKNYQFAFDKTQRVYALNAGYLPVGNYQFKGSVFSNGKSLTHDGQFSVRPVQLEMYETSANHRILRLLSDKHGGALLHPTELLTLVDSIRSNQTVKPVVYQSSVTKPLINLRWICLLLACLLGLEWFFPTLLWCLLKTAIIKTRPRQQSSFRPCRFSFLCVQSIRFYSTLHDC